MANKHGREGITRRDFLNGVLLATGGAAVSSFFPMRAFADEASCAVMPVNGDPRALRGGNVPSTFNVAHWLRDHRLTFGANTVTVSPSTRDGVSGTFSVAEDGGHYDVVIVGSGMSALAAAFFLRRRRPGTRILLLDANESFGGNAGRDDASPLPTISGTGGAYCVAPYAPFLEEIYGTTGLDWAKHYIAAPFYNYFFDGYTPGVRPGARGWNIDTYGAGLRDIPFAPKVVQDIQRSKQDFRNWYTRHGAPTDPADNSDPRFDYLAHMTLDDYLVRERGYDPVVSDFYTAYSVDALAGTAQQVNAFSSISFLGAEFNPLFALPGGTNGVARLVAAWLVPGLSHGSTAEDIIAGPIDVARLDDPGNAVRIRQRAVAVRADTGGNEASVTYWRNGQFYRARATAAIVATQSHSGRHLVEHLTSQAVKDAWAQFTQVPVVVANVAIRSAAPLIDLGLGYDQYWWGSKYWADFVIADWDSADRVRRDRETVLTVFGGNWEPPENMPAERLKLLTTPFCTYEASLREDLNRVLADGGFDFDRDVTSVFMYRWGHGMIYPKPGFPFGVPQSKQGQVIRTPAPRHIARQAIGRISFAGQDTESSPAIESAIGSGLRTATEVLALL